MAGLMKNKGFRIFLCLYFLSVIGAVMALTFADTKKGFLNLIAFNTPSDIPYAYVSCEVAYNLNGGDLLELRVLIPCKDKRHEAILKKVKSEIQHNIITGTDQKLIKAIRRGDLPAFKRGLLAIINKKLPRPVKTIYFKTINTYHLWSA